jgi:hypothetical protein
MTVLAEEFWLTEAFGLAILVVSLLATAAWAYYLFR